VGLRQVVTRAGSAGRVDDTAGASAAPAGRAASSRLAGIEGLRGLAALGVLTWHVWAHPTNGSYYGVSLGPLTKLLDNTRVGVAMFFVLSGFLLYRPFAAAIIRRTPRPSVRDYFFNRLLRILPAYWTVLLLVAALFQDRLLERPLQLLANMFFLQNYVGGYVPGPFHGLGIAPAWSLCVEAIFYLLLPALALGALLLDNDDLLHPISAAVAPAALLIAVGVSSLGVSRLVRLGPLWRIGFPIHAHWFGIGMLISIIRVLWEDGTLTVSKRAGRVAAVFALALAALALKLTYGGQISFEEEQSLLAVSCGILLTIVVVPHPRSLVVRFLGWRPLYLLGLASYSIFLWHDPLLRFLRDHGLTMGGRGGFAVDWLLVFGITAVLSTLTYLYVERPALALKRSGGRRPPPVATPEPVSEWSSAAP
jgi:peptidoglycan/LPS O-acetylase OafA/YrhL